ncbi:RING finger protein 37 isoform X1 [Hydra vulgaris]|uniref:RING finger protein 37 isoform X1 n=1 Tax=Hydra vulgaris TaxID=6087 RepID=UPI0032E9FA8C
MNGELINFADKALKTQISCSAISADGCCIENLIDQNQKNFLKPSYFMAEYYIKCPVEIVLTFPCLINISAIVVYPKVNSHRTRGFVLFTVFQKPILSTVEFPCTYNNDLSDDLCRKKNKYLMNQVGIYRESEKITEKIVFRNKLHYKQFLGVTDNTREMQTHGSVHSCSNIVLKITWSTIPSIKKLEVWGTLANINSRSVSSLFMKQFYEQYPINIESSDEQYPNNNECSDEQNLTEKKQNLKSYGTSENIPVEFIDPITCSMMTIPMLLPSGNTVDSSTLDKFIIEEQKYGRLPSDPFTGIVFNGNRYPIPNSSLKTRIDQYTLKNSELSREFDICNIFNNKNNCEIVNKSFSLNNDRIKLKRFCDDAEVSKFSVENKKKSFKVLHHEEVLHDSLHSSLSAALSVLPSSFYKNTIQICNVCGVNDRTSLLKLPCFHVCCRKCVIKMTLKLCNQCKKEFNWREGSNRSWSINSYAQDVTPVI